MAQDFKVIAGRNLIEFFKIARATFVCIHYAYGKPFSKFFFHDFCYLIAPFLMIASLMTYQSFYKICVNVTLRDYEVGSLIHQAR